MEAEAPNRHPTRPEEGPGPEARLRSDAVGTSPEVVVAGRGCLPWEQGVVVEVAEVAIGLDNAEVGAVEVGQLRSKS